MQEKIKQQIKEAMLARDTVRLSVLRGISAAFTNELVSKGKKPQDTLSDEDCINVIKRLSKQRKDSIEQFEKGGRKDLVLNEKAELSILETYLPQMMSSDDIKKIVEAKIKELNISDKSKLGMLTGAVMKELKGQADGNTVKNIIDSLFS